MSDVGIIISIIVLYFAVGIVWMWLTDRNNPDNQPQKNGPFGTTRL